MELLLPGLRQAFGSKDIAHLLEVVSFSDLQQISRAMGALLQLNTTRVVRFSDLHNQRTLHNKSLGFRVDKHQIKVHSVHRIFRAIFVVFFAIVKKFVEKKNGGQEQGGGVSTNPPGSAPDPEETTDLRQVTDETFHTYGFCPVRVLNLGRSGVKQMRATP